MGIFEYYTKDEGPNPNRPNGINSRLDIAASHLMILML